MISLGKDSRSGIFRVGCFKPLDAGCQIASHEGRLCFAWQGELGKSGTQSSPGPGEEKITGSDWSLEAALQVVKSLGAGDGGRLGRGGRAGAEARGWGCRTEPSRLALQGRTADSQPWTCPMSEAVGPHGTGWPGFGHLTYWGCHPAPPSLKWGDSGKAQWLLGGR